MVQNPLLVAPAISVFVSPAAGAVPMGSKSFAFTCTVHSNVKGPAQGTLAIEAARRLAMRIRPRLPSPSRATAKIRRMMFEVAPDHDEAEPYTITAEADYDGHSYTEGYP